MQVLTYIGLAIAVITLVCGIVLGRKLIKNPMNEIDYKKELLRITYVGIGFVVGFTLLSVGLFGFIKGGAKAYEYLLGIFGGLLFSISIYSFILTFMIHYYRKDLPKQIDNWLYRILLICIPLMMVTLFVWLDGYANYFTYPLANGINFEHGFVNIFSEYKPNIAWYALCILLGAVFVYFLCDHKMYVQYGKHGILESTFLVAFPAGILGARIFYVIGNWSKEFANQVWWKPFAIWEGGLTILGGAIMGIVVGVAWFMWRNKKYNIFVAVDIIVPTILLAQAIGRWGNFFNCEVHGTLVPESYFSWLPTVIFNNLKYTSSAAQTATEGMVYVPLFLIESSLNVLGYFLIAELFGNKLRKFTELGDLAFSYIIWYGIVRAFLEPLRDVTYKMGNDGFWSWIWSVCFIAIGMLLIAGNHIIRYLIKKHKKAYKLSKTPKTYLYTLIIFVCISVAFIVSGVLLMVNSSMPDTLTVNPFMFGLILLIVAVGFIFLSSVPLTYFIEVKRSEKEVPVE